MDGAEAADLREGGDLFDVKKFMAALGMREEDFEDEEMLDQQDVMDEELRQARAGDYDEDEDRNLMQSIVKGYDASGGSAGPMSNLISQLKKR